MATKPIEARTAQPSATEIDTVSTANKTLEDPANDRMRQMMTAREDEGSILEFCINV